MADKALRSLGKPELLTMLEERDAQIETLEKTVKELNARESEKAISFGSFENAGSIAEASLQVSNVFIAAQNSADKYLEGIREMAANSKQEADRIIAQASAEAEALVLAAEQKCADREAREKAYIESLWSEMQEKLLQFYAKYSELGELFAKTSFPPRSDAASKVDSTNE